MTGKVNRGMVFVACCALVTIAGLSVPGCPSAGPTAAFMAVPRNGPAPLAVQFTDMSLPGNAAITSWRWDFGDGSGSLVRNCGHLYDQPGEYTVSLTVSTILGADTHREQDYVVVTAAEGEGEGEGVRQVTTNLPNYPVMGYFEDATAVSINGETVALDEYSGLRYDVVLSEGLNTFAVAPVAGDKNAAGGFVLEATYDPAFSTSGRALLYNFGPAGNETIVVDLDAEMVLGLLPGVQIVASTNAGDFVVDTAGNVYDAGNHTVVGVLPFASSPAYPVFRQDDQLCYAARRVIDFASRTVSAEDFPVAVDGRYARLLPGNRLIQCHNLTGFTTVDLTTNLALDEAELSLQRSLWGASAIDPTGTYGLVTSYSWAVGAVDIGSLATDTTLGVFDGLSDYMGQVAFSGDGLTAFAGGYGNSYYGDGGVYAFDLADTSLVTFYPQFGASSIVSGPGGRIYVSTHYVDHFGTGTVTQGLKSKRGIDVLSWDGSSFTVVTSYYLNAPHWYHVAPTFFVKPRYAP